MKEISDRTQEGGNVWGEISGLSGVIRSFCFFIESLITELHTKV